MTNTSEPALPKQIQATVGSEAWWATHLLAVIAAFVAVATLVHPAWVPLANTARAWVTVVALILAVVCVGLYLVFALLHHKISIGTLGVAFAGEIQTLESTVTPGFLDTLHKVPALEAAITDVKAALAAQPDVGAIVRDELAKLGGHAAQGPGGSASSSAG